MSPARPYANSEEVLILPRVISSGPRETNERDEKGWFGYFIEAKAKCHSLAKDFWQTLTEWFDNWVRVVLTGCVIGCRPESRADPPSDRTSWRFRALWTGIAFAPAAEGSL